MTDEEFANLPESVTLISAEGWHSIVVYQTEEGSPTKRREVLCPTEYHEKKEQAVNIMRRRAAVVYLERHARGWERFVRESQRWALEEEMWRFIARETFNNALNEHARAGMMALRGLFAGGSPDAGPDETIH